MGYISFSRALVLALGLPVVGICGAPPERDTSPDLQFAFATCVGRFTALMQHQWLTGPQRSDETKRQQRQMIALLDAVTPPEDKRRAMSQRIQSKHAFISLLTRIRVSRDPAYKRWAQNRVERDINACRGLLLGPSSLSQSG
ncbi:hypothetical protein GI582_08450 [Sulfitobacter sp. BDSS02]|nr:hypothetical protein [Sulfitobacter sp. BDSS02]MBR9850563.1 hypothetical protein [Paracoccaceae bacterium]